MWQLHISQSSGYQVLGAAGPAADPDAVVHSSHRHADQVGHSDAVEFAALGLIGTSGRRCQEGGASQMMIAFLRATAPRVE